MILNSCHCEVKFPKGATGAGLRQAMSAFTRLKFSQIARLFRASTGDAKVKDMAAKTNQDVQVSGLFLRQVGAMVCSGIKEDEEREIRE